MKHRLLTALIAIAALALAATPAALADNPKKDKDTYVQLLAFNDFHGHVKAVNDLGQSIPERSEIGQTKNPTTGAIVNQTVNAGGVEYLSQKVKELRTANTNTITVGGGDLIGASPLLSGLFHDEPRSRR